MTLDQLASIATILTFFIYVFIEWPRLVTRLKDVKPGLDWLLIITSFLSGLIGAAFILLDLLFFFGILKGTKPYPEYPLIPAFGFLGIGVCMFTASFMARGKDAVIFRVPGVIFLITGVVMTVMFR